VEEIEDGIFLGGAGVVGGWGVDEILVLIAVEALDDLGGEEMVMELAVGDGGGFPGFGGGGGDEEGVGGGGVAGLDIGITGVELRAGVDFKVIAIDLRGEWRGGEGPGAGGVAMHGDGIFGAFKDDSGGRGGWGGEAEGDGAVRVELRLGRFEDGSLSGGGERGEEKREGNEWTHEHLGADYSVAKGGLR
jgi:hypothetical protein